MKSRKKAIGIIFIVVGIIIIVSPFWIKQISQNKMDEVINIIDYKKEILEESDAEFENLNEKYLSELYKEMQKYNNNLYENGQKIVDAFSYQNIDLDFAKYGIKENVIGKIKIPKIKIELPIYLGSTKENLNKGATILGETSMPLGTINANTVIAAHRGLIRHPMFRNIDKLQINDEIEITTFWDDLFYAVTDIKIIEPNEASKILIQENKDMVTLITCHPYRINTQRYVVYCQRI